MTRRTQRLLTAVAALGMMVAVGPRDVPAQAAPPHMLSTVHVGYIPVAELPMFTAIERGYFKDEGLNVVTTPMANGAVITEGVLGGSLDIGVSNAVSMLLAESHGFQLVAVTRGGFDVRAHSERDILIPKGSAIRSARDLEGKKVALLSLKGIDFVAMQQWLKDHGANPSRVDFTELTGVEMIPSLAHGQIAAAVTPEPARTVGLAQGMHPLGHVYADKRNRTFLGAFIALRPWAKSHTDIVRRFAIAYTRGSQWADANDTAARTRYLTKYLHLSAGLAKKIHLVGIGKIYPSSLGYWMQLAMRWHVLTKPVNVRNLIWPTAAR